MSKTNSGRELPLGQLAYRLIRDDILACRLAPGERITERGVAARLDLGITPVRDALTRLDHEHLVRRSPRKGYQVAPLTIESVEWLFQYWGMLGVEMARTGLPLANEEQVRQLSASIEALAGISDAGGGTREAALQGVELANKPFEILADVIDNEYMIAAYQRVRGEIQRVWTLVIDSELLAAGRRLDSYDECLRAIRDRDTEAFSRFTKEHIEQSRLRVQGTLSRWPSVVATEVRLMREA